MDVDVTGVKAGDVAIDVVDEMRRSVREAESQAASRAALTRSFTHGEALLVRGRTLQP